MGYYVSHCESGSWALMQARSMQHIIDRATDTTLCGRTPEKGRWYGNPRQLTQQSFHVDDCEECARNAVALGIWAVPKTKVRQRDNSFGGRSSRTAIGAAEYQPAPIKAPVR